MWVKWYKSPTAWVIIITAVVALVGAFLCAYYLPYPLNLITAIACCVPSSIFIRKVAMEGLIKDKESKE